MVEPRQQVDISNSFDNFMFVFDNLMSAFCIEIKNTT